MLFDFEVKTKKLERSHFIKNVYAHSDGKVLNLHLIFRDIYKPQLKIQQGCHVYHNGEKFTIQEYSFDGMHNLILTRIHRTKTTQSSTADASMFQDTWKVIILFYLQHRELIDASASTTAFSSAMVKLTMERRLDSSQQLTTS